jgi:hypothetical protein
MAGTRSKARAHNGIRQSVRCFFMPNVPHVSGCTTKFYLTDSFNNTTSFNNTAPVTLLPWSRTIFFFLCLKSGFRQESAFERRPDPDSHLKCLSGSVNNEKNRQIRRKNGAFRHKDVLLIFEMSFSFHTPDLYDKIFRLLFFLCFK